MTRFRSLRFVLLIGILLALFNAAAAQINNPINGYRAEMVCSVARTAANC